MSIQLGLKFKSRQIERKRLVRLHPTDEAYVLRLKKEDRFDCLRQLDSLLIESRSQRIGCSRRDLAGMLNYELSRELADEAFILFGSDPWHQRPCHIDWQKINWKAKENALQHMKEFEAFKKWKSEGGVISQATTEKAKRNRRWMTSV